MYILWGVTFLTLVLCLFLVGICYPNVMYGQNYSVSIYATPTLYMAKINMSAMHILSYCQNCDYEYDGGGPLVSVVKLIKKMPILSMSDVAYITCFTKFRLDVNDQCFPNENMFRCCPWMTRKKKKKGSSLMAAGLMYTSYLDIANR